MSKPAKTKWHIEFDYTSDGGEGGYLSSPKAVKGWLDSEFGIDSFYFKKIRVTQIGGK